MHLIVVKIALSFLGRACRGLRLQIINHSFEHLVFCYVEVVRAGDFEKVGLFVYQVYCVFSDLNSVFQVMIKV